MIEAQSLWILGYDLNYLSHYTTCLRFVWVCTDPRWGGATRATVCIQKFDDLVDQIPKQLNSGIVDIEEDLSSAFQTFGQESSRHNDQVKF
ncbi:hypothetical protein ACET3Z_017877 [Daucus carota]